jgi:hypothetical protein
MRRATPVGNSGDFSVSLGAGLCRALPAFAAAKGQEKGNVPNHDF